MDNLQTISFFLRMEPDIPHLTHQNGIKPTIRKNRATMYKTQELKNLEAKFLAYIRPYAPPQPWSGPVLLETDWLFLAPKKLNLLDGELEWKITRPDSDNLVKTFKDCIAQAGFVKDDAQICLERSGKYFSPEKVSHGIKVSISQLPKLKLS